MHSQQITVRNVDSELAQRLQGLSRERGESLNSTVLHLLRAAVGIDERRQALAKYIDWDAQDVAEFDQALAEQRCIQPRDWE